MNLITELDCLVEKLKQRLAQAVSLADLEELRVAFIGRKGSLAGLMDKLKELAPHERPAFGQKANAIKQTWPNCWKSVWPNSRPGRKPPAWPLLMPLCPGADPGRAPCTR